MAESEERAGQEGAEAPAGPEAAQADQPSVQLPPQGESGAPQRPEQMSPRDERLWATFCHLAAFGSLIVPGLGHILGPLIVWLLKRELSAYVDDQGKESLNFQISITIYGIVAALSMFALIGFVLFPAVILFGVIAVIVAAIKANEGVAWRYPLCIRFIK